MSDESRPGSRGGKDQFSWDAIREDKRRAYYLGNSLKVPYSRGDTRPSDWYLTSSTSTTTFPRNTSKADLEAERRAVIEAEKKQRQQQL